MKFLTNSTYWELELSPRPRLHCDLIYGVNKRNSGYILLDGILPEPNRLVVGSGGKVYFRSLSKDETWEKYQELLKNGENVWLRMDLFTFTPNTFKVGRTENDDIVIIKGEDTTDRLLVAYSFTGGFRGGVELAPEYTTAKVLDQFGAGNACESELMVIALLNPGERIVVRTYGRRQDDAEWIEWDGVELKSYSTPWTEYEASMKEVKVEEVL